MPEEERKTILALRFTIEVNVVTIAVIPKK